MMVQGFKLCIQRYHFNEKLIRMIRVIYVESVNEKNNFVKMFKNEKKKKIIKRDKCLQK